MTAGCQRPLRVRAGDPVSLVNWLFSSCDNASIITAFRRGVAGGGNEPAATSPSSCPKASLKFSFLLSVSAVSPLGRSELVGVGGYSNKRTSSIFVAEKRRRAGIGCFLRPMKFFGVWSGRLRHLPRNLGGRFFCRAGRSIVSPPPWAVASV